MDAAQPVTPAPDSGRRLVIVAFAVAVCIGLVLIIVGWGARDVTESVAIRDIWTRPERYLGDRVRTEGTLRVFLAGTELEHYAVEDVNQFRVGVQGVPLDELRALLDQPVRVEGNLVFTSRGLFINTERMTTR